MYECECVCIGAGRTERYLENQAFDSGGRYWKETAERTASLPRTSGRHQPPGESHEVRLSLTVSFRKKPTNH